MKIFFLRFILCVFTCMLFISRTTAENIPGRCVVMNKTTLLDKIKGGWAGQTIACSYGAPVEFKYLGTMVQDYIPLEWSKERIKWCYDHTPELYDDVYVDITFAKVIDKCGFNAPADSFATAFSRSNFPLWHANENALYNIRHGIMPPRSGYWKNNAHADDIDFEIECDFLGLMSPGMPNVIDPIVDRVGHIMGYGDGWYGGVYVSTLYTLAFVNNDLDYIVREALKKIPEKSDFYKCINDIYNWHKQYPNDWKRTWFECEKKWGSEVGCPSGVLSPFCIDAKINCAYVVIGLLYGNKDFYKSIDICARCGQDSDSNPATLGGILGAMIGYSNIPEKWKEGLYGVENRPFAYTGTSLNEVYNISFNQALLLIKKNKGSVTKNQVFINIETPRAVRYEKSFVNMYPVIRKIIDKSLKDTYDYTFVGTGFVQRGEVHCTSDSTYHAIVALYVDGKLEETADLPVWLTSARDGRRDELFFKYDLPKREHKITMKWLNPRKDAQINITKFILYSDKKNEVGY